MTVVAVMTWLTLHSCSVPGAAGIVANLHAESRLDPVSLSRSGAGIAQWAGARRRRLLSTLGRQWTDGYAQLRFLRSEALETGLWERVCRLQDAGLAARIFMREFERPRARSSAHRESLARNIAAAF